MTGPSIFDRMQERSKEQESHAEEKAAAKTAALASLSAIRTISKVLSASLSDTTITEPQKTEARSRKLIEHIGRQTLALHEKLGSIEDARILPSLTGSVTTTLQALYRTNGDQAFDVDVAGMLAHAASVEGIWKEPKDRMDAGSLEYRRTMSMMHAFAPVMASYQAFDFYYPADKAPVQELQDIIWSSVDQTLNGHPVIERLDEAEKEMLRRNLMLRAGELLSSAWDIQAPLVKAEVNELPAEDRRAIKTEGYPLDKVYESYEVSYAMLERSFDIALRSQYEAPADTQDDDHRPAGP